MGTRIYPGFKFGISGFMSIMIILTALVSCKVEPERSDNQNNETKYTCPMHPQVVQDSPGQCPVCGMDLVPVSKGNPDSNDLMLSETQVMLANITTQKVSFVPVGQTVVVNARLVENEERREMISSRAAGRIEKLFVKETGRILRQNEPLYELYSETLLTLQKEYLLAKEQFESLGSSEKRYESFLKAAERKLLLYGLSPGQINKLAQTKDILPRITFLSPAGGIVTGINVVEGQYVAEGAPLYQVDDISTLWVEAELYPSESSLVNPGDKINLRVTGFENTPVEAKVTFLSPEYRANTQIIVMRAALDNKSMIFKPGMQAQVLFTREEGKGLAVPTDAVIRDGIGAHVYIQKGENTFRPQMVKTGMEDFNQVEITEGLEEGDTVVITGAYLLYSEIVLKKGTNPMAGHDHGMTPGQIKPSSQSETLAEDEHPAVNREFSKQLGKVLLPYLAVKDALVASDGKAASEQTGKIAMALSKVDMSLLKGDAHEKWMGYLKRMNDSAKSIRASVDIEEQRASFAQFSEALYSSIKTFHVTGIQSYYQFCPMALENKGAYWISREEEISNPYFGEQMLRCGETKETLK